MTDHISNPGTGRFVADILTPLKDRLAILPGSRDRQNRPIIFFPSTETGANSDDLKNVLQYFYFVTSDDCKKNGFLFILGTKKGSTKQSVKPILRSIQDFFPGTVSAVFIIKQDNFLDKLKLNSSSNKYKFDVHDISMENLTRFIDSSQLLKEFGGNLHYDHEEWIELRRDIERTIQKLTECLEECCDVHNKLVRKRHSQEIGWPSGAGIYDEIETKLLKIDSDKCDEMVKIIIKRILSTSDDNYNSAANLKTPNPDLAYIIPNLNHLVKKVVKGKTELLRKWSEDKIEQDRWKQFKIFETDFLSFKEWIVTNTRLVEEYFSSIGNNLTDLQQLIQQNDEIVNSTENSKINLEHVIKIGKIMIENGNSGKGQVEIMLKELDHRWNYFITKLDQRSKLLTNCLQFRIKTEKFFEMNEIWKEKLNNFPDDLKERNLNVLEEDVKEFDKIGSEIEDVYSEAAHETTLLSETMKMQLGNDVGQSESFKLVVGITQRLAREKRTIQNLFETKKEKYCLKLAYEAFLDETPKVMAWLTEYGEPYLSRKTNIGENIEQARLLTKNHEDFQRISSNTYRNAQHLREAGERLRNIPEYNNSIVNNRLIELQNMIDGFTNRVNQRTEILKLSQMFHLHFKEIMKWYDTLSNRTIEYETVPENDDAVEIMIEKLLHENDATRVAFNTVMSESAQLMKSLKQQHEMFGIDITTMKNHIEQITNEIREFFAGQLDWTV
uniref:CRAL-TRIO domain-containing protein n=1 Tax=Panagrolaimus sp. JU765 TaxID=591449 RepID=A0AC34RA88_9BILA